MFHRHYFEVFAFNSIFALSMKRVRQYIKRNKKWTVPEIMDTAQKRVYYNVSGLTDEDMAEIVNRMYQENGWSKARCVKEMLLIVSRA